LMYMTFLPKTAHFWMSRWECGCSCKRVPPPAFPGAVLLPEHHRPGHVLPGSK
jgi:hypothetical protein